MKRTPCDCSLIIPTFNRRVILDETLSRIERLPDGGFETIVVDNGSTDGTPDLRRRHRRVRWIELGSNLGSAARNVGAAAAHGRTLLMLDDDSWPAEGTVERIIGLFDRRLDLGAAACRVRPAGRPDRHEVGGLPGVFFNCGGAIRRSAYIEAGGFPVDFDYYVEEYDLCCRLWQRGWRVEPRGDLPVWHRRTSANRDANRMLRLLVRNNLRLWQRYAPGDQLEPMIQATMERYRRIAKKENATEGFLVGLEEGRATPSSGNWRRRALSQSQFEHLFGLPHARERLRDWTDNNNVRTVALWTLGKGCEQLLSLLSALSIRVEAVYDQDVSPDRRREVPLRHARQFNPQSVDGIVIGSLSPGVAEDLFDALRRRFPKTPVLAAVAWVRHERENVAVPA